MEVVIIALVCVSVTLVMLGVMAFVLGLLIGYKLGKSQSEISVGEHRASMTNQSELEDAITETQRDPRNTSGETNHHRTYRKYSLCSTCSVTT